jgi:hypothetical protein
MGNSRFARCLQGGGVNVGGCTICGNTQGSPSVTISSSTISGNTVANVCTLMFESSHRPHGKLIIACCLQGGGVYVYSGTVTITSSSIYGNTANNVRAHAKSSHRPDGKMADVLAPTHACTTANASVNYRGCVPQRPWKTSHRPDGKVADVLAPTHTC